MARQYRRTWLVRFVNSLVALFTKLGFALPNQYLLEVRGRKSGKLFSTPVILVKEGNRRWLVSPYGEVQWVKNARAAGQVTLRRGGRSEKAAISEIPPEQRAPVLQKYLKQAPITSPYFHAGRDAPLEAFAAEGENHPVFEILS